MIEPIYPSLANEIRYQTSQLQSSLDRGFREISNDLESLQTQLHYDLTEIRWLLAEQNSLLREILDVLKKRRKVEAQELVVQSYHQKVCK